MDILGWLESTKDLTMRALVIELGERGMVTSECSVLRLVRDATPRQEPARRSPARPTENPHLFGGLAVRPHRCTVVLDGPINGKSFIADIRQMLVPTLSPGSAQGHSSRRRQTPLPDTL
jgi:hypothetical protein